MRDKETLLERAKRNFREACDAEHDQRQREKEDLEFQVPEKQWSEEAKRQRLGFTNDKVPTPARPILSIPKLDQPIQLVANQQRNAHLGIKITPLSPEADDDVAEIIQGLYRRVERDSNAHIARSWAFDRAIKCGRGWYRILTRYDEQGGHPFDQVITIERILDQSQVYADPAATLPDFSDGNWIMITAWVPIRDFRRMYPGKEATDDLEFMDQIQQSPEWVRGDGESMAVLVAEYYYKEYSQEMLVYLDDGQGTVLPEAQVPKGAKIFGKRRSDKVTIKWAKLTGFEVLEEEEWSGQYLPFIPVLGRELQPFDQSRRWVGIIGPAKDAQRLFNYAASAAVEMAALEPKAPFVGAEGQFEGHESEWQQANVRNFPYLEYKTTSLDGVHPAPPPQRMQVDVSRLGPSMQLLQQADNFIQGATATFDPSLGRTNQKEQSGRAITALQQQADAGTSNYLANLADISMPYEAKVILDLIPKIYDRPGRLARTLDVEDDTEMVMLNTPFVVHPQTKRPMMVEVLRDPDGKPLEPLKPAQQLPPSSPPVPGQPPPSPPEIKYYDLRKGVYSVAVSVGRSRNTLQQEGAEEIGQILQAAPNLMPLLGPIYFKFRDFPGHDELAELMTKLRDKQFPGLEGGDSTASPEQLQQQLAALQQQMQLQQQQLQAAMKAIEVDEVKSAALLQKAALDNETKERIAAEDNRTRLMLEQIKEGFKARDSVAQREHEKEENDQQMAHEVGMGLMPKPAPPLKEPLDVSEEV